MILHFSPNFVLILFILICFSFLSPFPTQMLLQLASPLPANADDIALISPHPLRCSPCPISLVMLAVWMTVPTPSGNPQLSTDDISVAMQKLEEARVMTIKKIEQLEIDVEELEIQETETLQEVLIFPFFFA